MAIRKIIIYKGRTYRIQSSGKYYQDQNRHGTDERLLHRKIWSEHNGPIPLNHCIHHKNGKWHDNRLSNLELVPLKIHAANHIRERWKKKSQRRIFLLGAKIGRPLAAKWHKSPEGRAWHSENSKRQWENRKPEQCTCIECGKEFESIFPAIAFICSTRCQNLRALRLAGFVVCVCNVCGKRFKRRKHYKGIHCSHHCASITTARKKSLNYAT